MGRANIHTSIKLRRPPVERAARNRRGNINRHIKHGPVTRTSSNHRTVIKQPLSVHRPNRRGSNEPRTEYRTINDRGPSTHQACVARASTSNKLRIRSRGSDTHRTSIEPASRAHQLPKHLAGAERQTSVERASRKCHARVSQLSDAEPSIERALT